MPIQAGQYVGASQTTMFIGPDDGLGPFVPVTALSPIGAALLTAPTAADALRILGAAPNVSAGITPLAKGGTGSSDAASAAAALGVLLSGAVKAKTGAYSAQAGDGVVLVDATAGTFNLTAARALGAGNTVKVFVVLKTDAVGTPVNIIDDTGAVKFTLINGGMAFAVVVVKGSVVYAAGVQ